MSNSLIEVSLLTTWRLKNLIDFTFLWSGWFARTAYTRLSDCYPTCYPIRCHLTRQHLTHWHLTHWHLTLYPLTRSLSLSKRSIGQLLVSSGVSSYTVSIQLFSSLFQLLSLGCTDLCVHFTSFEFECESFESSAESPVWILKVSRVEFTKFIEFNSPNWANWIHWKCGIEFTKMNPLNSLKWALWIHLLSESKFTRKCLSQSSSVS